MSISSSSLAVVPNSIQAVTDSAGKFLFVVGSFSVRLRYKFHHWNIDFSRSADCVAGIYSFHSGIRGNYATR